MSGFDQHALAYDAEFTQTLIGKAQRDSVHRFIAKRMSTNSTVLELNCGTGEDALWFAHRGHRVVATDVSEAMLKRAREKAEHLQQIIFKQADLTHPEQLPDISADLIFSNFGGLNCLSPQQLTRLSPALAARIEPNGRFIAVVMGKSCTWEQIYFSLKAKRAWTRKSGQPVPAHVAGEIINTWYYSPQEFYGFFSASFRMGAVKPIGLFVPPSYLNPYFRNKPAMFGVLRTLDRGLAHFKFQADFADHYLIELIPRVS